MANSSDRRTVSIGLGILATLGGIAALGVKFWPSFKKSSVPSASATWNANVVSAHGNIANKDFHAAAENFGFLTDEAFTRVNATMQAWLGIREHHRGLFPRKPGDPKGLIWNYKDCAADLYGHLVLASFLIAPDNLPALRDVLAKERAISAGLPQAIDLRSGLPENDTTYWRVFGAVEYAKDGLLPVLERIGKTEWLQRLYEVADAVVAASPIETRFGRIPATDTEKNGEFLQVLARLYLRDRRPEYLKAGRAIAEAYILEVLPGNAGVPATEWDFERHRPRTAEQVAVDRGPTQSGRPHDLRLPLRDHGNEILAGLSEWAIAETQAPDSKKTQYDPVIQEMMDKMLLRGRYPDGMWATFLAKKGETPKPSPNRPLNDNWGYLAAVYVAYAMTLPKDNPRHDRYRAEAERTLKAAIEHKAANWSSGADGYADSLEGAQYLLPFTGVEAAPRWLDEEMGRLLAYQGRDGFVMKTYLDGNYVRTGMLYALYRTQGTRLVPWRPGVRLGAVNSGNALHIAISVNSPWTGRLIFDSARHQNNLNLPFDYPRLNGWPEWFAVDPKSSYEIRRSAGGTTAVRSLVKGTELIEGLVLDISDKPLHLTVSRAEGA